MVQVPHYPKGSDVANLARARWGRAIDMNIDQVSRTKDPAESEHIL